VRRVALLLAPVLASVLTVAPVCSAEEQRLDLSPGVSHTQAADAGTYLHTFGALTLGKGVHTNNPFRLGSTDAFGFTATYLDLALGLTLGRPDGLQHGGQINLSLATDGVPQEVLGFSYVALLPLGEHALVKGRAGLPVVLAPDSTVGLELGAGGAWLFTGGLGISAELVGSLFYGAATQDRKTTTIPVIALQVGMWFDHEVLP
jgi:hypothetical protein